MRQFSFLEKVIIFLNFAVYSALSWFCVAGVATYLVFFGTSFILPSWSNYIFLVIGLVSGFFLARRHASKINLSAPTTLGIKEIVKMVIVIVVALALLYLAIVASHTPMYS